MQKTIKLDYMKLAMLQKEEEYSEHEGILLTKQLLEKAGSNI